MTGRAMRKTAMPRGRPPRPRRLRQRRKQRRSRRKRKSSVVSAQDVREAAAGLVGVAVRTPLRFIETLNVYLKLESLQPIGAFKLRGAYNAVRRLPEAARRNGVITYSSGNHGQALAYAAQLVGVRAVVVMPETAPAVKVAGVKKWGGEVVLAGRTSDDRQRGDRTCGGGESRDGVGGRARRRPEAQALARGRPPGAARAHRQHRGRADHARRGGHPVRAACGAARSGGRCGARGG